MSFFVDANVLVYGRTTSEHHDACADILEAIARGDIAGQTSTAVLEEIWHLELTRGRDFEGITEHAYSVLKPLLAVTDEIFRAALVLDLDGLGANDRVHAATCLANGIDTIVSADASFDRVPGLRRVDPLDDRARRRLLAG